MSDSIVRLNAIVFEDESARLKHIEKKKESIYIGADKEYSFYLDREDSDFLHISKSFNIAKDLIDRLKRKDEGYYSSWIGSFFAEQWYQHNNTKGLTITINENVSVYIPKTIFLTDMVIYTKNNIFTDIFHTNGIKEKRLSESITVTHIKRYNLDGYIICIKLSDSSISTFCIERGDVQDFYFKTIDEFLISTFQKTN